MTDGAVVSCTVTSKLLLPVLPAASVAVQVTVVVPRPKVEPEAGAHVTGTLPSTRSVALAVKVTTAPDGPVASIPVMFAGTVTAGAVVSWTVTVKLLLPVLRAASVAEQMTVVVPSAKVEPEAGTQTGVRVPSTMSVALALKVTAAPEGPVASATMLAGTVTVGGVVSTTKTAKLSGSDVLPAASVAVQSTCVAPSGKSGAGGRDAGHRDRAVDEIDGRSGEGDDSAAGAGGFSRDVRRNGHDGRGRVLDGHGEGAVAGVAGGIRRRAVDRRRAEREGRAGGGGAGQRDDADGIICGNDEGNRRTHGPVASS